jgi:hypothetical protein
VIPGYRSSDLFYFSHCNEKDLQPISSYLLVTAVRMDENYFQLCFSDPGISTSVSLN